MGESVKRIVFENEDFWGRWKENKCADFERPKSKVLEGRKRDAKRAAKMCCQGGYLIRPKDGEMNDPKNGKVMFKYLKMTKESIDDQGNSVDLAPANIPAFSEYLYPFLADQDPEQGIEEAYKRKNFPVFTWRFLREISLLD